MGEKEKEKIQLKLRHRLRVSEGYYGGNQYLHPKRNLEREAGTGASDRRSCEEEGRVARGLFGLEAEDITVRLVKLSHESVDGLHGSLLWMYGLSLFITQPIYSLRISFYQVSLEIDV